MRDLPTEKVENKNYTQTVSSDNIIGALIGVRPSLKRSTLGAQSLFDIAFRVVGQTKRSARYVGEKKGSCTRKGGSGQSWRNGKCLLESLSSKHRHTVDYLTIRKGLDEGILVLVENPGVPVAPRKKELAGSGFLKPTMREALEAVEREIRARNEASI